MAYLGDVYLHTVISEQATRSSELTEKPVEKGTNVSDHIKKTPLALELNVVLPSSGANHIRNRLIQQWENDTRLTYKGENTYSNLYIVKLGELSEVSNRGGYSLEITLEQPHVAKLTTYKVKVKNPVTKKQDAKTATKVKQTTNIGYLPRIEPIVPIKVPYVAAHAPLMTVSLN